MAKSPRNHKQKPSSTSPQKRQSKGGAASASLPPKTVSMLGLSALLLFGASACVPGQGQGQKRSKERWVTTENAQVDIDWDAVGEAYKKAEGPEDFERRVNEIYTGSEIISVAVQDEGERRQVVTGFFDRNVDGQVADAEKIFSIQRDVQSEEQGQYQIQGYGAYSHYRSPVWDIAAGMMLGSMISRAFSPGYRPMYGTPYVTPSSRRSTLQSQRTSYRKQNPQKFSRKGTNSRSGRSYGRNNRSFGGTRRSGGFGRRGGRFGAAADRGVKARVRLG